MKIFRLRSSLAVLPPPKDTLTPGGRGVAPGRMRRVVLGWKLYRC